MSIRNVSHSLLAAAFAVLLFTGAAGADSYHYRNILVGERAAGMGGAYTAISDDPSGLFYNPAGIAYIQGSNISASANAYHNTTKTYSDVIGGRGWERNASAMLPNFFGVIQDMGGGKVGLAYVVPDSIIEDQDQTFYNVPSTLDTDGDGNPNNILDYSINFNNEDNTSQVGLAYAKEFKEGFSAGVTLYYHTRRWQQVLNQYITFDNGATEWTSAYYESEESGFKPVLGFMLTPTDRLALGLSLSKVMITDSQTISQSTRIDHTGAATRNVVKSSEERDYPMNLKLGLAYFTSDRTIVSGDISYNGSAEDVDGVKNAVTNVAIGSEYYFSPNMAMRFGFFTNYTSAPELVAGVSQAAEEHVDLYGLSLTVSKFGKGSALTAGIVYGFGSGESQISGDPSRIQDMDVSSTTLFLSNSYNY